MTLDGTQARGKVQASIKRNLLQRLNIMQNGFALTGGNKSLLAKFHKRIAHGFAGGGNQVSDFLVVMG